MKKFIFYTVFAVVLFIILLSVGGKSNSKKNYSYNRDTKVMTYKCQVCNRTFTDSDNKSSIRSTNMCENCYKNYKEQKAAGY